MWARYRRFAIYNQLFIVVACATAYYALRMSPPAVAMLFAVMQAGALLGARWSASLARRPDRRDERLPLERK